jgi:hypothetical protein
MQRDDGDHDRQTEAVTGQTSAAIETVEALDDPGALGRRDAGAVVLNDQGDGVGFFGCPNPYRRPLPAYLRALSTRFMTALARRFFSPSVTGRPWIWLTNVMPAASAAAS